MKGKEKEAHIGECGTLEIVSNLLHCSYFLLVFFSFFRPFFFVGGSFSIVIVFNVSAIYMEVLSGLLHIVC